MRIHRLSHLAISLSALFLLGVFCSFSQAAPKVSARATLLGRVPEAKLDNVSLSDALDYIREVSGANLVVDWRALNALNVTKDSQVNVNLRGVRLEKLLDVILSEAAGGDTLMLDLVTLNTPFMPNVGGLPGSNVTGGSFQGGGGGGGGSTPSVTQGNQTQNATQGAMALIQLIETTIRPEVWKDNGGNSTIDYWNGYLIINAPRSVQEAIGGPLY
jgi:hypothetical protein